MPFPFHGLPFAFFGATKGDKDYQPNPEHYLGSRWTFTLADLEQARSGESWRLLQCGWG